MHIPDNQQRIKTIYRMLLEIINGNLAYRIPLNGNDIEFDELAKLLNEFATKLQEANYFNPYVTSDKPKEVIEPSQLIQKVQDYILNHLEEDLPSTKALAQMFGTNEFILKQNFRTLFKTSVYQYYNDERLKKARLLIEQTTIPLANIALVSGFNNYTNFYKAFKKKYNQSPSDLGRQTATGGDTSEDSNIDNRNNPD
jgi:AraC-like DNA-binding protein